MFYHNLKLAFRTLLRNKIYSLVNIGGLALGIAVFLLLLEYVSFERSFNNFQENAGNTYRLLNEDQKNSFWPEIEPGWAPRAKEKFPAIIDYCRLESDVAKGILQRNTGNAPAFRETSIGFAEGNFFEFFSFPLLKGNAASFHAPNTIFLSAGSAEKYFGNEEPVGQQLILSNQFGKTIYQVGGVFEIPANSDIRYDQVLSLETLRNPANLNGNDWAALENTGSQYLQTYLRLTPGTTPELLETKLTALRNEVGKENDGVRFRLQSFQHLHLAASLNDSFPTAGNIKYLYILSLISVLILLIAWFNYVNLSTAQALKKANEVGVRKIAGASRLSLIGQFLVEAMLVNLLGFVIALLLVYFLQPLFNSVMALKLSPADILSSSAWMFGSGLLLAGSLLTGTYTAFALSGFNPIVTLRNRLTRSGSGSRIRKTLVVTQFAISIALIIGTVLIYQQLRYLQEKNIGVTKAQMLIVRGPEAGKDSSFNQRQVAFLQMLSRYPFVEDYAGSGTYPGGWYNFVTSGFTQPGSLKGDEFKSYAFAIIDERYLPAFEIPLVAGRNFRPEETGIPWDKNNKVLLNETAVAALGFKNPDDVLHTPVQWDERALQVIGVVKDYNHANLKKTIMPMIFYPQNSSAYCCIRLASGSVSQHIAGVEKLYKQYFPGNPFEYFFLDENYQRQYAAEKQYGQLFTAASVWAVIIACLGLFGLTTFTVTSRTKEIGIRKVLGASVLDITQLLSRDFLLLVGIAALIAFPVAWWAMQRWLQDFPYRINISWWVFALAAVIASVIALITIGFQSVRAALSNPVKNLRTE
ncbi:ABC transporter permease [Flavihumibacter petaseus]|uniref:Putative ABC transporter permease protein n=1 Tax=Flavihumibacter petaseus NBRC 106054 TaxID=1220578 RepID=A0A0E9N347_9BACT|nr:ABC transporter permease [Flavihumibacter petaseus]GAO44382.1 putative ABC transporter permease protein [Flavihumibacter petaseus NBRC 106054]